MKLTADFFQGNRKALTDRLPEGTAVFLFAGSSRPMSRDDDYRFLVDRDFYYLTGLEIQDAKLILTKDREYLFIPFPDEMKERWHGKRMRAKEASGISGIRQEDIHDTGDFDTKEYEILEEQKLSPAFDGLSIAEESNRFAKDKAGALDIGEILTKMRMVKKPEEVKAIREAAMITEAALKDMKKLIKEGATEMDLYTSLDYNMARSGSLIPAFTTITAIGNNAFYLHHGDPEGEEGPRVAKGCQIQIDVGARCAGYCADISRVYFYGDREGEDDKRFLLHELITKLRRKCWETIRPGITFDELNKIIRQECGNWLLEKGLLSEGYTDDDVKKYYWHNTGHHLGLDVHDVSVRDMAFEAGNCLAIEPGVYIPEWNTGFRIEDDVLVTEDGCELISSGDDSLDGIIIL